MGSTCLKKNKKKQTASEQGYLASSANKISPQATILIVRDSSPRRGYFSFHRQNIAFLLALHIRDVRLCSFVINIAVFKKTCHSLSAGGFSIGVVFII